MGVWGKQAIKVWNPIFPLRFESTQAGRGSEWAIRVLDFQEILRPTRPVSLSNWVQLDKLTELVGRRIPISRKSPKSQNQRNFLKIKPQNERTIEKIGAC